MREEQVARSEKPRVTEAEDTESPKRGSSVTEAPSFIPREDQDSARRSDDAIDDLIVLLATKADRS